MPGTSVKTLGTGNTKATNTVATTMPSTFVDRMNSVRMTWMRTRRRS